MASGSFRIASFKALPGFARRLFLRHPPAGALSPLLSKAGSASLAGPGNRARRACLRAWENAARRTLATEGWKPEGSTAAWPRTVAKAFCRARTSLKEADQTAPEPCRQQPQDKPGKRA